MVEGKWRHVAASQHTELNAIGDTVFSRFRVELDRYVSGVHRLYAPAPPTAIEEAEVLLGVRFPHEYRLFLETWNGGLLFAKQFHVLRIWHVWHPAAADKFEYEPDLVGGNIELRQSGRIPKRLLQVADLNTGDCVTLDTKTGRVAVWDHERNRPMLRYHGFTAWLEDEMIAGANEYDYNGDPRFEL